MELQTLEGAALYYSITKFKPCILWIQNSNNGLYRSQTLSSLLFKNKEPNNARQMKMVGVLIEYEKKKKKKKKKKKGKKNKDLS